MMNLESSRQDLQFPIVAAERMLSRQPQEQVVVDQSGNPQITGSTSALQLHVSRLRDLILPRETTDMLSHHHQTGHSVVGDIHEALQRLQTSRAYETTVPSASLLPVIAMPPSMIMSQRQRQDELRGSYAISSPLMSSILHCRNQERAQQLSTALRGTLPMAGILPSSSAMFIPRQVPQMSFNTACLLLHSNLASTMRAPTALSAADHDPTTHSSEPNSLLKRASFPVQLHRMLLDLETKVGGTDIARFTSDGRAFQVCDVGRFQNGIMKQYFPRMNHFTSFQRQLNLYDFTRIDTRPRIRGVYYHLSFIRDRPALCEGMRRRKIKGISTQTQT